MLTRRPSVQVCARVPRARRGGLVSGARWRKQVMMGNSKYSTLVKTIGGGRLPYAWPARASADSSCCPVPAGPSRARVAEELVKTIKGDVAELTRKMYSDMVDKQMQRCAPPPPARCRRSGLLFNAGAPRSEIENATLEQGRSLSEDEIKALVVRTPRVRPAPRTNAPRAGRAQPSARGPRGEGQGRGAMPWRALRRPTGELTVHARSRRASQPNSR